MDSIQQYKNLMSVYVCTHKWLQFYKNENGFYFKGAKKVKYRLEGKQFYRDYNMSPEKLKKIQNTIKLFELMN
jgi:hypothetical protein